MYVLLLFVRAVAIIELNYFTCISLFDDAVSMEAIWRRVIIIAVIIVDSAHK
jgi:hypothetical protein